MHTHLIHGQSPVVLSVPHDGAVIIPGAGTRQSSKPRDLGTLPLARSVQTQLHSLGVKPSLVWFDLHRSQVDLNRKDRAQACVPQLEHEYDTFHEMLNRTLDLTLERNGQCLLLDIHRCSFPQGLDIILGSAQHQTSLRSLDCVFAKHLRPTCSVTFSPDPTLGIDNRYSGGWIIRRTAKRFGTYGLDAVQLEFNEPIWHPDRLPRVTHNLALAIVQTIAPPRLTTPSNEKQAPF